MPTPSFSAPVLIVGAGPTGLTLAHELARRGVPFRQIDLLPAPSPLSRALGIHARTLELFDLMGGGLAEAAREKGVLLHGALLHFPRGREAELDLAELPGRHPGVVCLPQGETEALLAAAAARHGAPPPERGVVLEEVSAERGGSGVAARLLHPNGWIEEARFAFVVGCDGAHSAVRRSLRLGFAGASYPEQFLLADLAVEGPLQRDRLHLFPSPDGLLAFFPLPGNLFRVVASMPSNGLSPAPGSEPSLEEVQAIADARCPRGLGLRFSGPRWRAWFRIHHRIASRLRGPGHGHGGVGRIFLAGDAAHIHSPAGGQGMNTGIQDAFNLGWKLARVLAGGPASLLDSYEAERLPVDRAVVKATDTLTRIATLGPGWRQELRNRLVPFLAGLPTVRSRAALALSQLAIHYRGGPLSEEHPVPGSGPRAGERAPDVALPDGGFLSGRFLPGGLVGLFLLPAPPSPRDEEAARAVREILEKRGAETATLPLESEAAAQYGTAAAFYLLRPDGYVGLRAPLARAAELLPAYLEKV